MVSIYVWVACVQREIDLHSARPFGGRANYFGAICSSYMLWWLKHLILSWYHTKLKTGKNRTEKANQDNNYVEFWRGILCLICEFDYFSEKPCRVTNSETLKESVLKFVNTLWRKNEFCAFWDGDWASHWRNFLPNSKRSCTRQTIRIAKKH